uniref:aralkylamine N-acetyltransferase n=1 Tax=Romanomermis culicivorax TaxID=13658 RepID=A0A915JGL2_ROMCU
MLNSSFVRKLGIGTTKSVPKMAQELIYEVAKIDQRQELVDFIVDHFCRDEPISRSLNMSRENSVNLVNGLVDEGLSKPISFVCLNKDRKIVGCRLNALIDKDDQNNRQENRKENRQNHSKIELFIENFLEKLGENFDQNLEGCRKYLKFILVSVDANYQRRGIATKLIELSIAKAKEIGCQFIAVAATANRSQKMFQKLGFQKIKSIMHENYLDENGQQIFKCDDGTNCGEFYVLKL